MDKIKSQFTLKNLVQFIKLQIAGNILFWGTLIGSFVLHEVLHWNEISALVTASLVSHFLFFLADRSWVFDEKGTQRKTGIELVRFAIFMTINFFINLLIITGVDAYLDSHPINLALYREVGAEVDINLYLAQFAAAAFFTLWTFVGLKYWVFRRPIIKKRRRT